MKHKQMKAAGAGAGFSAIVMGALLGAAAIIFSKKENRQKLREKMNEFLEMGEERIDEVEEKVGKLKEKGRKKLSRQVDRVSKKLQETGANN